MPQFRYYERLSAFDDYFDRFSFRPRRLSRLTRSPHVCVYSHIAVTVNLSAPCFLYTGQAFRYSSENALYI